MGSITASVHGYSGLYSTPTAYPQSYADGDQYTMSDIAIKQRAVKVAISILGNSDGMHYGPPSFENSLYIDTITMDRDGYISAMTGHYTKYQCPRCLRWRDKPTCEECAL